MYNNDFGKYIRFLRIDRNLSLSQLAERLSITPYYISYLENGKKRNPSTKIMAKIFKTLEMDKCEIEHFLDLHAKANGCVSYDVADFIMSNRNILEAIRAARDKPEAAPNWNDFMEKINKKI